MSSIKRLWRESMVIARRDFLAVAATPTFLLFLLAPLFMLGMGMVGGIGASGLADSAGQRDRMVLITDAAQHGALRAAEKRLRALNGGDARDAGPPLVLITPESNAAAQAARLIKQPDKDTLAIGYGPLSAPTILEQNSGGRSGIFLAALAEQVLRDGEMTRADTPRSTATFRDIVIQKSSNAGRQTTGFFCVFILFFLSLMLSSQTVGMMAEEKTNKVIEILAASIPLEAVFFGKLIGMFGIAILFVAFWGSMGMAATFAFGGSAGAGTAAGTAASTVVAGMPATAVTGMFAELAPAIGWPLFFGFGFLYFTMAFMLLGSIFLVIGALAAADAQPNIAT